MIFFRKPVSTFRDHALAHAVFEDFAVEERAFRWCRGRGESASGVRARNIFLPPPAQLPLRVGDFDAGSAKTLENDVMKVTLGGEPFLHVGDDAAQLEFQSAVSESDKKGRRR